MNYLSNPWIILWLALGACILVLALYRKTLASREDDIVHVSTGDKAISAQLGVAQRLEKIDFWGKTLTIVLVVYGLALGGILIYQAMNSYYQPVQ